MRRASWIEPLAGGSAARIRLDRMLMLALDAALSRSSATVLRDGMVVAHRRADLPRGQSSLLAPMAQAVLTEAGIAATSLDAVAVTVGPGSFTGVRAALALAQGLALGAACAVVGVTIGEAMAEGFDRAAGRTLWTAIDTRRGRVFLDRGGQDGQDRIQAFDLSAMPVPDEPVAIAGDAAVEVAAALAAGGGDVMLTALRLPLPRHVAAAAARRLSGDLPPRQAQPLYVDPPEAKLPAGGLRPPPAR